MSAEYIIRPATEGDRDRISTVLACSYSTLLKESGEPLSADEALSFAAGELAGLLSSAHYHVAEHQGSIIGCGGWMPKPPASRAQGPCELLLRRFAVLPDWSRKGIGSAICSTCLEEAPARAGRILVRSTLGAVPFYASFGFRPVHPVSVPLPGGAAIPTLLMVRGPPRRRGAGR